MFAVQAGAKTGTALVNAWERLQLARMNELTAAAESDRLHIGGGKDDGAPSRVGGSRGRRANYRNATTDDDASAAPFMFATHRPATEELTGLCVMAGDQLALQTAVLQSLFGAKGKDACEYHGGPYGTPKRWPKTGGGEWGWRGSDSCFGQQMAARGLPEGRRSKGGFCLLDVSELRINKHTLYQPEDLFRHPCMGVDAGPDYKCSHVPKDP